MFGFDMICGWKTVEYCVKFKLFVFVVEGGGDVDFGSWFHELEGNSISIIIDLGGFIYMWIIQRECALKIIMILNSIEKVS